MKRKILNIIELLVIIIVVSISIITIAFPDKLDMFVYNIMGKHVLIDANTLINKKDIIEIAKNKDYSKAIFYPYYELLDEDEKEIYSQIFNEINKYNKNIKLQKLINKDDITKIYTYLTYDHPEIFWLGSTYSYSYNENNEVLELNIDYLFDVETVEMKKKELDNEVNKIVIEAKKLNLDYEKELYVHDKLSEIITYGNIENQTAYDALVNKVAVCSGYSKAFQLIMLKIGIPTYYVTGYSRENHAWNLIELEDGLYNVDLTWDDQENRIIYNYFNLPEDVIVIDHNRDEISSLLPLAHGKKYINNLSPLIKR